MRQNRTRIRLVNSRTAESSASPLAPLLETLQSYFAVNMNVAEAALRLNVHRNTVRYRLARIEELLGMRLNAPRTIANLHLALLTERLEGSEDPATANGQGAQQIPLR